MMVDATKLGGGRLLRMMLFLVVVFVYISCSDDTINRLDGSWQQRTLIENNTSYRVDTIFYNFDKRVCAISTKTNNGLDYGIEFGTVAQTADSLVLSFPDQHTKAPLRYRIVELNSRSMQLESGQRLLQFRKF